MIIFCNMIGFYGMYLFFGMYFYCVLLGGNIVFGLMIMVYGIGFFMSVFMGKIVDKVGKMCFLIVVLVVISIWFVCFVYVLLLMLFLVIGLFVWGLM